MSIRLNLIVIICSATASFANTQSKEIHGPQVMTETGATSALTPELSGPQFVHRVYWMKMQLLNGMRTQQ